MSITPFRSGYFRWQHHELAYEVWGSQGTPCLLMHGILMDSVMNRPLARRFVAEGYQVILLDFLGHGRSDKPLDPRAHRIDFNADQAIALLDHLGIERALIGGVSLGANTSLQLAAHHPERCLGLFLEMPVMEWSTAFTGMIFVPIVAAVDYFTKAYRPFARLLRRLPKLHNEVIASLVNGFSAEPEVINAILHGTLVGPVVPAAARRRAIEAPTLVIGHTWDRIHQMRDAVALARELPNAHFLKARFAALDVRHADSALWPEVRDFLARIQESRGSLSRVA